MVEDEEEAGGNDSIAGNRAISPNNERIALNAGKTLDLRLSPVFANLRPIYCYMPEYAARSYPTATAKTKRTPDKDDLDFTTALLIRRPDRFHFLSRFTFIYFLLFYRARTVLLFFIFCSSALRRSGLSYPKCFTKNSDQPSNIVRRPFGFCGGGGI